MFLQISQSWQENTCVKDSFLVKTQIYRVNNFIEKEIRAQMFSFEFWEISRNHFLEVPFGRLLLHKHLLSLLSHHNFCFFKNVHTYFPAVYFFGLIHRLGIRVSPIFQTLSQTTPIFNAVEHLRRSLKPFSTFVKKSFRTDVQSGFKIGSVSSH